MQYFIVGSLLSIIIVVAGWLTCFYDRMTNIKIRVDTNRAHLYMEYQETNDLIQDLAQIVSNHTNQVQSIQPQAAVPTFHFADELLTGVTQSFWEQNIRLETLLSLSNLYPEIQADQDFIQIQQELYKLQQRTGLYRQSYIESVLTYNKFLSTFPNNIAALTLGIKELSHDPSYENPNPALR